MKSFSYEQPKTLKEASKVLSGKESAIPFAGGTDALDLIKHDIISPDILVNLKAVEGTDKISQTSNGAIRIGSMVKVANIAGNDEIKSKYTILAEAAAEVASPQLRNMGTIAGNICQRPRCWYFREDFNCLRKGGETCYAYTGENKYHCIVGGGPCYIVHPSDLAVALIALEAELVIVSGKKERKVPIADFFILPEEDYEKENILKPGEVISEIILPTPSENQKSGYIKFKERGAWDFAVVSVGAVITKEGNKISKARVAFGGVAPIPWIEEPLNDKLVGIESINEVKSILNSLFSTADPLSKNEYKIQLARNMVLEMIEKLV